MTFNELTPTISVMRSGNSDVLSPERYDDDTLSALNYTAALADVRSDLEKALGVAYDDTTTIDAVADKFSGDLGRALAYKQLSVFYQQNDTGAGTKNRARWELYRSAYERERFAFSSLSTDTASAQVTSVIFKR